MFSFIELRFVDILDIVLSAYLMYVVYRLIRGTMAANIVLSILAFLVFWVVVRALNMSILSATMGSFVNIGLLALIVIFQQEIRNFLVILSSRYSFLKSIGLDNTKKEDVDEIANEHFADVIVKSCTSMSQSKTGALIVIQQKVGLKDYVETGDIIDAQITQQLIETIFFKNTPLHDGAMIVDRKKIVAAGCILPVSKDMNIPKSFGLRHRSALGITEVSDAISVVVSEETGNISVFMRGTHYAIDKAEDLVQYLNN